MPLSTRTLPGQLGSKQIVTSCKIGFFGPIPPKKLVYLYLCTTELMP